MVRPPLREWAAALACREYAIEPLALPLVVPIIEIQLLLLEALQAQPTGAATETNPVSAPDPCVWPSGVRSTLQGAPFSLIVRTWPAIITCPVRGKTLGLGLTAYAILLEPLPVRLAGERMV